MRPPSNITFCLFPSSNCKTELAVSFLTLMKLAPSFESHRRRRRQLISTPPTQTSNVLWKSFLESFCFEAEQQQQQQQLLFVRKDPENLIQVLPPLLFPGNSRRRKLPLICKKNWREKSFVFFKIFKAALRFRTRLSAALGRIFLHLLRPSQKKNLSDLVSHFMRGVRGGGGGPWLFL